MNGKCAELAELISALADGELPEAERARVGAHLDACPRCRRLLESYRLLDGAVAGAAAPPAVSEARWAEMSAAIRRGVKGSGPFITLRVAAYVLAAAAAALLAVFLGLPGGRRAGRDYRSAELLAVEPSDENAQTQTLVMMAPEGGLNLVIVTSTAAAENTGGG